MDRPDGSAQKFNSLSPPLSCPFERCSSPELTQDLQFGTRADIARHQQAVSGGGA